MDARDEDIVMHDNALPFQTITEIAALIQSRQLSPVEVTQALLARIEQLDGRLQSYATVMADHALAAAKAAEQAIVAGTYRFFKSLRWRRTGLDIV
jgi:Asp-tRNA(Asn)/Glu-tRNA(Gln) amidotransferase A subunit family amidase